MLGFLLWAAGTILIRCLPGRLILPGRALPVLALYAVSFAVVFFLVRGGLARRREPAEARGAAIGLVLPTLVLDAFASAFFPAVYPNLPAAAAGVFAGWMLIFCAAALAGALTGR